MKLFEPLNFECLTENVYQHFKDLYALIVSFLLINLLSGFDAKENYDTIILFSKVILWLLFTYYSISILRRFSSLIISFSRDVLAFIPVLLLKGLSYLFISKQLNEKKDESITSSATEQDEIISNFEEIVTQKVPFSFQKKLEPCTLEVEKDNQIHATTNDRIILNKRIINLNILCSMLYFLEHISLFNPGFKLSDKKSITNKNRTTFYDLIEKKTTIKIGSFRNSLIDDTMFKVQDCSDFKDLLINAPYFDDSFSNKKHLNKIIDLLISEDLIKTNKLNREGVCLLAYYVYRFYSEEDQIVVYSLDEEQENIVLIKHYIDNYELF